MSDSARKRGSGLVTAFRTLTIIPIPGRDAHGLANSLPWFPLVGAVLGGLLYGVTRLAALVPDQLWTEATALVVLILGVILTRGLHLDGVGDWADGFGGSRERSRVLEIMKDSQLGTFGVLAIVLVLLTKWVALVRLVEAGQTTWIVAAFVVSRTAMTELAVALPYVRPEGGTAQDFVSFGRPWHRQTAWLLTIVILVPVLGPQAAAAAAIGGWILTRLLGLWWRKRLGGVTGDLLGTTCELVEAALLIIAPAMSRLTTVWNPTMALW